MDRWMHLPVVSIIDEGELATHCGITSDHSPFSLQVTFAGPFNTSPDGQSNLAIESHIYSTTIANIAARNIGVGQFIPNRRNKGKCM